MAVPGRRNGMMEDEDNDVEEGLFEEDGLVVDADTPPHLRNLAVASQSGDLPALRLALGIFLSPRVYCSSLTLYFFILIVILN